MGEELKVGDTSSLTSQSQGATVRPMYAERQPVMWAVSESDLRYLSALNLVSAMCFSISSFLGGCIVNIYLSVAPLGGTTSELGKFLEGPASKFLGGIAVLVFIMGLGSALFRRSILRQIRLETKSEDGQKTKWQLLKELCGF